MLALYTKLRTGSCLTHVGREGQVIDNGAALGPSPVIVRNATVGTHRIKLVWSDSAKVVSTVVLADQTATVRENYPNAPAAAQTPPPPSPTAQDCGCKGDLMCLMKCSGH